MTPGLRALPHPLEQSAQSPFPPQCVPLPEGGDIGNQAVQVGPSHLKNATMLPGELHVERGLGWPTTYRVRERLHFRFHANRTPIIETRWPGFLWFAKASKVTVDASIRSSRDFEGGEQSNAAPLKRWSS